MLQMQLKEVGIDYPHANEEIEAGQYSFRITAPNDAREVRISIDDQEWKPCRASNGHWWCDFPRLEPGDHVAVVRVIETDGSVLLSQPRLFKARR